MRQIVLDTETTGLDPAGGDRIVEIACLELVNKVPTGKNFRKYLNPERDMPNAAEKVHGLSRDFLADQPRFADIVDDFLKFIADSPLIIHNAVFDLGFLNAELARLDRPPIDETRAIDTLSMARRKFPGAQASLDALCRRFEIDLSAREQHGALLDVELLAQVYLELSGGRQPSLGLQVRASADGAQATTSSAARPPRPARQHQPDAGELTHHGAMLTRLTDPIWLK